MKKEKNLSYYRNLLHKDGIALLVVAVIFTIASFLFMLQDGYSGDLSVPIFLKSIMFIVLSAILVCNKKETKKFIGILTIIISCLMILTSIGDGSLFGIVYFLLGIFLGIHSILYLIKFKNYNVQSNYSDKIVVKNSKIKYLSLIPIIITIILFIVEIFIEISWYSTTILVVNIANIIFCIILHNKKIKSAFMYIMLAISIMITLFSSLFVIDEIRSNIEWTKYKNSNEYKQTVLRSLEDSLADDVSTLSQKELLLQPLQPLNNRDSYVLVDKKHYEEAIHLWNEDSEEYLKKTSAYEDNKLNGTTCDGYVEVRPNYEGYSDCLITYNNYDNPLCDHRLYNYIAKTYIKCTGEYNYQTQGFDENKFNESKTDEYYKMYSIKKLEIEFGDTVVNVSSLLPFKPTESSPSPVFVSKKQYEELESKYYFPKLFAGEELKDVSWDGYVKLELDQNKKIIGNAYITCTGKYNYQTDGFDDTKLK